MLGPKSYHLLRSMGIANIQTLSMMPPELLGQVLGKNGIVIWKKANGIDLTPVVQYSERKSIGTERTFDRDTTDVNQLRNILIGMVEKIAFEMRQQQKLTGCITVKIRYSNFDTHNLQRRISYTSFDHILIKEALELFENVYKRRMLIRLIGVRFSHLVGGSQQLDLFDEKPELANLYQAMDHIRTRFGKKAVQRAVGMRKSDRVTKVTE